MREVVVTPESIAALVTAGAGDPRVAAVGPRIVGEHGALAFSQRRFARLRSTFSNALFLQRLAPLAESSDEMVRDPALYELPGSPDWVSGACVLLRRDALEHVGGLDERYFLYREDMDVCLRLRNAGWTVRYEPGARARHIGSASSRPGQTVPIFVASRMQYARAHFTPAGALLERIGVTLWACTHWLASVHRPDRRRGFAGALRRLASPGSTHLVRAERR
jgi:N-acetylglucosaminyl-diphospho-decaprenol L-rhamnosyltransferase